MPSIDEFFGKYNNKGVDFDGYYGFQCVDLYRQYVDEVPGFPQSPSVRGAADIWNNYLKDYFYRIDNTPEAIPQKGDIVIWNTNAGGGFGHIGIFSSGDINSFVSFDQNWPIGSVCHFQPHNYTHILGWLRPKAADPIVGEPAINDQTHIPLGKIGEQDYGSPELQAVRSIILERDRRISQLEIPSEPTPSEPEGSDKSATLISQLIAWIVEKLGR